MRTANSRAALFGTLTLVLGVGLGFLLANRPASTEEIRINAAALTTHIEDREALLGRPLVAQEQQALLDRIVQQEVLVREAARLDLHRKDQDMRKHLIALMQHVLYTEVAEPTNAELQAFHAANRDRYLLPESVSFEHVFFGEDRAAAEALARAVRAGAPVPDDAGQVFWLGRHMQGYYFSQLLTVLGHDFARALKSLPQGEWSGPVRSGRGWHLVRLQAFHPRSPLPAEERDRRLREDWKKDALNRTYDAKIAEMSGRYRIVLPEFAASPQTAQRDGGDTLITASR